MGTKGGGSIPKHRQHKIKAILFDFGGVIAEEGFREGLKEIGRKNGLDPDGFFSVATELVYSTGYVTGHSGEEAYWYALREKTGIKGTDSELRNELLDRFVMRQEMLGLIKSLQGSVMSVSLLSDQTNWLDELNKRTPFFNLFDHIFNSYHMHKSKRDPALFPDICRTIGFQPEEVLFVDDNPSNTERAEKAGLKTIAYKNLGQFRKALKEFN